MPSRVRISSRSTSNSARTARTEKNIFPIGSVESYTCPPSDSRTPRVVSSSGDGPRIGDQPGEPVQLGDHKGVALADGGEGLGESGTVPVGSREAVVDVDAVLGHAELAQPLALRGEVLLAEVAVNHGTAEKIEEVVRAHPKFGSNSRQAMSTSFVDELAKRAALRDAGVLTAEEFEIAKRKLIS